MFFSSPSASLDFTISLFLLVIIISFVVYIFSKKSLESILFFSLMSNALFFYEISFRVAKIYNILWLYSFSRNIWPYINIALLILLAFKYAWNLYIKR